MRLLRLLRIIYILRRYNLYQILRQYHRVSFFAFIIETFLFFVPTKSKSSSLAIRTRMAFEDLGPVFVKFGQLLSTRQDIIPQDFVTELAKLQSEVPPFNGKIARQIVSDSLNMPLTQAFSTFSEEATASASIAQVHYAVLKATNQEVAVKILRPNIAITIKKDIALLKLAAWLIEKFYRDGKRLKPREVVNEFAKVITTELDFQAEAANATELGRLHQNDDKIIIPKIFYDYCSENVLVLEWKEGIKILDIPTLRAKNIDLEQLSHNGVAIFYTQVFDFGFFHADMHPGNILCDEYGRYIALDFGIVGSLSLEDKRYLALNILAFFNRDYKKVAITHIESGWAPDNTNIEELEAAIRRVCEPIFNKPLAQISFGQVLIKLFQVSRQFDIPVQPQLLLLQKTIVNVEGLGRVLNPNLDLWVSAKPILERWMARQMGIRGLINNIKTELPYWSYILPKFPQILANHLDTRKELLVTKEKLLKQIAKSQRHNSVLLLAVIILATIIILKLTI